MNDIIKTINTEHEIYKNKVIYNNFFIMIAMAVCVGMITQDSVKNIMNEIITPAILFLINTWMPYIIYSNTLEYFKNNTFLYNILAKFSLLLWLLFTWIIIIILIYIIFNKILINANIDKQLDVYKKIENHFNKKEF